jgi:hypothetical protein
MDDGFRCEQQHAERRDCQRAEGERRAIDHHSYKHNGYHDERALGRNLRARQHKVERSRA